MPRVASTVLFAVGAMLATSSVVAHPPRSADLSLSYTYGQYLQHWGKETPTDEAEHGWRRSLFMTELAAVLAHNANPHHTYKQGLNQFSDRTAEERSVSLMATGREAYVERVKAETPHNPAVHKARQAPARNRIDYRTYVPAVLTAVKDQGNCGSCWSFGTMETLEAHVALQTGVLADLSEQQIISCAPPMPYTMNNKSMVFGGCHGYTPSHAYHYIATGQHGIVSQEYEIPYESFWAEASKNSTQYRPTPSCMNNRHRDVLFPRVNVTGPLHVSPSNSAAATEQALLVHGPVAAVISVPPRFFSYESGIFNDPLCEGSDRMTSDHVVQLVGYGYDKVAGLNYWIVRNSWSPWWGENGYIRLFKAAADEVCGEMVAVAPMAPIPLNFTRQVACGPCGLLSANVYPALALL